MNATFVDTMRLIRCNKGHPHRTHYAVARCRLGRHEQIRGDGQFAVVEAHVVPGRRCRRWWGATDVHVTLFDSLEDAADHLAHLPTAPCSGTCREHYLTVVARSA